MTPPAPPKLWKNGHPKPIIGILGGIGSGKSTISQLFASQGCAVIDSDALNHQLLQSPAVKSQLKPLFGDAIFNADGTLNRKSLGQLVFANPGKLAQLNALLHPLIKQERDAITAESMQNPGIRAVVWDSPLLLESHLDRDCDVLVFVSATPEIRAKRILQSRSWTPEELSRRENLQFSLDKKASVADYCVDNSGEQASSLRQVQQVLSHLLLDEP